MKTSQISAVRRASAILPAIFDMAIFFLKKLMKMLGRNLAVLVRLVLALVGTVRVMEVVLVVVAILNSELERHLTSVGPRSGWIYTTIENDQIQRKNNKRCESFTIVIDQASSLGNGDRTMLVAIGAICYRE